MKATPLASVLGSLSRYTLIVAGLAACSDDAPTPASLPSNPSQPAIATEATDAGADAAPPRQLVDPPPAGAFGVRDRAGRPLVSQLLVSAENRALYNEERPYLPYDATLRATGAARSLGGDFQSGLVSLDALDGHDDWNGGSGDASPDPDAGVYPHPLTDAWLADALLVDPSRPFSPKGFLDLEANPGANATCGGRWLADDAIDKTLSFLINGTTSGVSDGLGAATKAPSLTFPYFAPPN